MLIDAPWDAQLHVVKVTLLLHASVSPPYGTSFILGKDMKCQVLAVRLSPGVPSLGQAPIKE